MYINPLYNLSQIILDSPVDQNLNYLKKKASRFFGGTYSNQRTLIEVINTFAIGTATVHEISMT